MVWVNIVFDNEGKKGTLVLTMAQGRALEVSKALTTAANEAEKKNKVLQ
jgi:hypothetical protein